jgi:hypothetical protein
VTFYIKYTKWRLDDFNVHAEVGPGELAAMEKELAEMVAALADLEARLGINPIATSRHRSIASHQVSDKIQ